MLRDTHWWVTGRARILQAILDRAADPGGSALDVGSGNGFWAKCLEDRYNPVWAVEPDPKLREKSAVRLGLSERVIESGLPGPLPFDDKSFKLVTCLDVLEHVEQDHAAIKELARLVAEGGHLLIAVPANPKLWADFDVTAGHFRRYTAKTLKSLIVDSALHVRLIAPMNVWLYGPASLVRRLGAPGASTPRAVDPILRTIFSSERWLVERWPRYVRGLSLVCLAERRSTPESLPRIS